MSAPSALRATAKLYQSVIDDVVNASREAFLDEGVDETLIKEFKELWEAKLKSTKAIDLNSIRSSSNSSAPCPPNEPSSPVALVSGSTQLPSSSSSRSLTICTTTTTGSDSPTSAKTTAPASSVGVPLKRGNDRPPPVMHHFVLNQPTGVVVTNKTKKIDNNNSASVGKKPKIIAQIDGPGGLSDDEDDANEDFLQEDNLPSMEDDEDEMACQGGIVEEGEPLNSDDDDLANENADELFEADDVIVCQYEKVVRTRNKWKFQLKDGVMNLRGKDYVFNKAVGESEF